MNKDLLILQLDLVKKFSNKIALENIITEMQPLIKKYAKKLYFMEYDDAFQELTLSLLEAIYKIRHYENDYMCLAYFKKAIINKYIHFCNEHFKSSEMESESEINENTFSFIDNFNQIELDVDLHQFFKGKNENYKRIIEYAFIEELNSSEIAFKMGVSRQYINKIKNQVLKKLGQEYKDSTSETYNSTIKEETV